MKRALIPLASVVFLCACQAHGEGNANVPGDPASTAPFEEIGKAEELRFTGTEPFWGGQVKGTVLTYTTPEDQDGQAITVARFAGRGGISFSGRLAGDPFDLAVTQGQCSDGMSDRTYPFAVTLKIGAETRSGCAWSAEHPFTGPQNP